ncbi:unnamed protein product [Boreogadus saida]
MVESNLTSLGTNINSSATQLMAMTPTAERTVSQSPVSTTRDNCTGTRRRWRRETEGEEDGRGRERCGWRDIVRERVGERERKWGREKEGGRERCVDKRDAER